MLRVFLHREGQILVEVSSLLQSRLRRRLLLCQCTTGLSVGTSQGINQSLCVFSHSFSSHVFILMNCYGQVNNGSLIAYEKVYCIQGVVKFIESCTLGYIGWEWLWCWCLHGTALISLVIHTQVYKEQSTSYSWGTRPVFLVELLQIYGEYNIWALKLHWKLWPFPLFWFSWSNLWTCWNTLDMYLLLPDIFLWKFTIHGVIYNCWMSAIFGHQH